MKACEVCGAPLRASPPDRVQIDGAIMTVCGNCAKLGKPVGPLRPAAPPRPQQQQWRPISSQPTFRPAVQRSVKVEVDYDVDPDYNLKIRQAREKMGLSQEQLGKLLNEKPSVIRMVEAKKLKPDIALTRKFMHELKLNLLVSLSELEGGAPTKPSI